MTHSRVTRRDGHVLTVSFQFEASRVTRARALYDRAKELDETPSTYSEAEHLYLEAIRLDPGLAIAYTNIGNVRYRLRDILGAERWYREALERDPKQPEATYNLGTTALEEQNYSSAIKLLKRAIALDSAFADAWFTLADATEKSGNVRKAKPYWQRFLELSPTGEWSDLAREHLAAMGSK